MGDTYSYVGCVVGATYPEMGKVLRKIMPKTYSLCRGMVHRVVPPKILLHYFNSDGLGAIVNSSRESLLLIRKIPMQKYGEANYADASRQGCC